MSRLIQFVWQGALACSRTVLAFAVWTLWLALALLLAAQIYVATTNEIDVPTIVLRGFEDRLAASGLRVKFTRSAFDPTGRILIEDAQVLLPAFEEPVVTARAIYVRLDAWALAIGRIEPSEIRVFDATASVPAMLSPSGQVEEIVRDLDATLVPGNRLFNLPHLSGRVAGITVSARGVVPLRATRDAAPPSLADFLARQFPQLCRQALAVREHLAAFEQPALHLELSPSESGAPVINVALLARKARFETPFPVEAREIHALTRLALFADVPSTRLDFSAAELRLPFGTIAQGVRAGVAGRLRNGDELRFDPRDFSVTAESLVSSGFTARSVSAELLPGPLPRLHATVLAQLMDAPLTARIDADLSAQTAVLRFRGDISPGLLEPISQRLAFDVRRYFDFSALHCAEGLTRLGPGWKFEQLAARIGVQGVKAYGVPIDEGTAAFEFDGRHFHAPEAYARIGVNFARGSFDQDLATREYRFLLDGRLRPLEISPWFRAWWSNFFAQFEFPAAPPEASADVRGFWREGRRSAVFIRAEAVGPVIRQVDFSRVKTRMYIRPGFYDGLEALAWRGDGSARGTFTYTVDPTTLEWQRLDLELDSTLDVGIAGRIIGPVGDMVLAPFRLSAPPQLKLRGRFDGAAAPGGRHQSLAVGARTKGELRFHDFPVHEASFTVKLNDDEIRVEDVETRFAGGTAAGRARVWSEGSQRRIGFDFSLKDAHLGEAAATLQEFLARQRGQPAPPPGKLVRRIAKVQMDVAASAEGRYGEPYTYKGGGSATLRGAEIGEVPLLGLLSELIKFTTLRFTEARGNFKIDGPKLIFPEVGLRGANSAIDGHGEYALNSGTLDFRARVFPFQESGNLLKSVVGAVLSPLSNVLEVKLTGTLDKPQWAFVLGPTNILRSLAGGTENPEKADPATPPPAASSTQPSNPPPTAPSPTKP